MGGWYHQLPTERFNELRVYAVVVPLKWNGRSASESEWNDDGANFYKGGISCSHVQPRMGKVSTSRLPRKSGNAGCRSETTTL